jgi:hypothetical protein
MFGGPFSANRLRNPAYAVDPEINVSAAGRAVSFPRFLDDLHAPCVANERTSLLTTSLRERAFEPLMRPLEGSPQGLAKGSPEVRALSS